MQSSRLDFAGELRDIGSFITGAKFKFGRTHYEHREVDLGIVGTTFRSTGYDSRVELTHAKLGQLHGAIGAQFGDVDFSAQGAEAFIPSTNTRNRAMFLFEDAKFGQLTLSFGARHERTGVRSDGGGPADPATGNPRLNGVIIDADDRTGRAVRISRISYGEHDLNELALRPPLRRP